MESNDIFISIFYSLSHHFIPYIFIISITASSKFLPSLTSLFICSFLILGGFSFYVFISSVISLCKPFLTHPIFQLVIKSLIWNFYQNIKHSSFLNPIKITVIAHEDVCTFVTVGSLETNIQNSLLSYTENQMKSQFSENLLLVKIRRQVAVCLCRLKD
jgi:hypothetical protein